MAGERSPQLNTVRLIDQAVAQNAAATSEWWDISNYVEWKVWIDMDSSGAASVTYVAQFSPQGYYELNQLGATVTTDDYEAVTLSAANTTKTLQNVSSEDIADLKEPARSMRIVATEQNVAAVTSLKIWITGWS